MNVIKIAVAGIAKPDKEHYIRAKYDKETVARYVEVARPKKGEIFWPFPPIKVSRFPEPGNPLGTEEEGKGKKKAKVKGKHEYRLEEGLHRLLTALEVGLKDIPAIVVEVSDVGDSLALQLQENLSHGFPLDLEDRDQAIRRLRHDFNWKTERIAKLVNLHPVHVTRIAGPKPTKPGAKKRGRKGKGEGEGEAGETERKAGEGETKATPLFTPTQFFDRLYTCAKEWTTFPTIYNGALTEVKANPPEWVKGFKIHFEQMADEILEILK